MLYARVLYLVAALRANKLRALHAHALDMVVALRLPTLVTGQRRALYTHSTLTLHAPIVMHTGVRRNVLYIIVHITR